VAVAGALGLIFVTALCAWVVFREPWEVTARRNHRRDWRRLIREQRAAEADRQGPPVAVAADGVAEIDSPSELEAFVRACDGDVQLDLSEVEAIDTVGLCALLHAQRVLESQGHRLVLTGLDARRRRVFAASHLDDVITVA
jgi:anti-anti-sigma factor